MYQPVSYTHLDLYKRQLEIWLGGQISPPLFPVFLLKFLRTSEKETLPSPALPRTGIPGGDFPWGRELQRRQMKL